MPSEISNSSWSLLSVFSSFWVIPNAWNALTASRCPSPPPQRSCSGCETLPPSRITSPPRESTAALNPDAALADSPKPFFRFIVGVEQILRPVHRRLRLGDADVGGSGAGGALGRRLQRRPRACRWSGSADRCRDGGSSPCDWFAAARIELANRRESPDRYRRLKQNVEDGGGGRHQPWNLLDRGWDCWASSSRLRSRSSAA